MACRQNEHKNHVHFPNSFPKSVICLASQETQVLIHLASIDGVSTKALVPAAIKHIEVCIRIQRDNRIAFAVVDTSQSHHWRHMLHTATVIAPHVFRATLTRSTNTPTHQRTRARMYTHLFSTSSRSTPVSTLRLRNSDQPSQFRFQPADNVSHLRDQKAQVGSRPA